MHRLDTPKPIDKKEGTNDRVGARRKERVHGQIEQEEIKSPFGGLGKS